ncbi:chromatin segregase YTA7 NDAI_0B00780 [Naumovozyma dairenensis CBS 421]|uniref:Bromo domain-containing protein n=1 Tax=Naumovozyma dairenensis (strain ATCC 10597 / BCRC 20456 / CBS 421 / NBRC 0211 / NRRL Y-12639) TaxID=1071378 RepID=G0W5Q1_NAUDC|nr:hypothetical protein NDAI_0B00780 [Naumovozyma dairenensis CBS 421]CCD23112.1 hypothetical protein NDAI_0B00780 [Naumovozyma dairenensis CBS 421]
MTRNLRNRQNKQAAENNMNNGEQPIVSSESNTVVTDANGIVHTSHRSLRRINYAEIEKGFDFLEQDEDEMQDDIPHPNNKDTLIPIASNDDDDNRERNEIDNSNGNSSNKKRKMNNNHHHDPEDDDESFNEEDAEIDEDEILDDDDDDDIYTEDVPLKDRRRRADKQFIVQDNDDDDDDEQISYRANHRSSRVAKRRRTPETTPPRQLRSLRSRTRSSYNVNDNNNNDNNNNAEEGSQEGNITLADEIRELQEDSPIQEKRSLRERRKPVNYRIPPPLSAANPSNDYLDDALAFSNPSPSRRGRNNTMRWNSTQNMGPTRRLFPTGGPFGGNDVTTIFGKNTNFYNQDLYPANIGANTNNKLLLDSDSSDDEILPLGATPKAKSKESIERKKNRKKKPEIADLDPLGVDMNISFDDVGGLDNYIDQLKEMVALPLLYPELYQTFNITPPRGVLFHGPPGTGKTLMARALAASCSSDSQKITFFMRKGADILSKWVGEAERQLRLLFEEAKKHQPSIIFFDEIDGLAPVRSSKQEQIHASIVSTLLALMDGMDNRGQVIVIGATNRPDAVDPALRRPGRFDREFYFPLPDEKARSKILKIHTKKWNPPLSDDFIDNLATLTKGYGGADLRALCTEAALFCIQRKFPQIYRSNEKLLVDPKDLKVTPTDFMLALEKIVPSSARSTGSSPEPLPDSIKPLLERQFEELKLILDTILPKGNLHIKRDTSLIERYIEYEDLNSDLAEDNNTLEFNKHKLMKQIEQARICKPRLIITGPSGNGQQYISAAILNYLDKYNVQKLDLASLFSETTKSMEATVVQSFIEARKRQPSVILIPNIDIWLRTVPPSIISTLSSLLRSLQGSEKILLLAIGEDISSDQIASEPLSQLSLSRNIFYLKEPSTKQRTEYFNTIASLLKTKPTSFHQLQKRAKPLAKLPTVESQVSPENLDSNGNPLSKNDILRKKLRSFQHQDMKLKNILKIKLSGLMDLFKNRYKRFRKPPIDDALLIHLFEPQPIDDPNWQPAYVKDNDMILEVATGRRFFNMDLDIVEERLWNGYYSEPKQYLKDIELIYRDANTMGDRERIIKASEMFANAQMGIEDISTPDFIAECKATKLRDLERKELSQKDELLRLEKEKLAEQNLQDTNAAQATDEDIPHPADKAEIVELGVAAGTQLQLQIQEKKPHSNKIDELNPEEKDSVATQESGMVPDAIKDASTMIDNIPSQRTLAKDEKETEVIPTAERLVKTSEDLSEDNVENSVASKIDLDKDPLQRRTETSEEPLKETIVKHPDNVIVDERLLESIVDSLQKKTKHHAVSYLENIYSEVIELVWEDRYLWDKTETVQKIIQFIEN